MSCDITRMTKLNGNLTITGERLLALRQEIGKRFPENCNELFWLPPDAINSTQTYVFYPRWCGAGSGHMWRTLIDKVLPATRGAADIIYTWEGGEGFDGVRVVDGRVSRHRVVMTLGEERI